MAAELRHQLPETQIIGTAEGAATVTARHDNSIPTLAQKRHRRPSVRLGEIGDQPATLRATKSWRLDSHSKSSKIRPLTNLVNGGNNTDGNSYFHHSIENNGNLKSKEFKGKREGPRKVRTNWTSSSRNDEAELAEAPSEGGDFDERETGENEQFRDFRREDSESIPIDSADNLALDTWHGRNRRSTRSRIADSHDADVELNGIPELDSQDRRRRNNDSDRFLDEGVRNWLIELGLGKYAPVFEIHEVDDEVLPFLTLEDLKDMGINTVGSRRKMYSAIQKLRQGFA